MEDQIDKLRYSKSKLCILLRKALLGVGASSLLLCHSALAGSIDSSVVNRGQGELHAVDNKVSVASADKPAATKLSGERAGGTSSGAPQDSLGMGGSGSLVANIGSDNGELLLSLPLGSVPGVASSASLGLSYNSQGSNSDDQLANGWSFNLISYNVESNELYLGSDNYVAYFDDGSDTATFEGHRSSNLLEFIKTTGTLSDGRSYDYVLKHYDGSIEYLKSYGSADNHIARVIEHCDRFGNRVDYYYVGDSDPDASDAALLSYIQSDLGNKITVSYSGSDVVISLPSIYGHSADRTITLSTGNHLQMNSITTSDGEGKDYQISFSHQDVDGMNYISQIVYPSGMRAEMDYDPTGLPECATQPSGTDVCQMAIQAIYKDIRYVNDDGSKVLNSATVNLNMPVDDESGQDQYHNYTGFPHFMLGTESDTLLNSTPNGYYYKTKHQTNNALMTESLYNQDHLNYDTVEKDSGVEIRHTQTTYDGETQGKESYPPAYSSLPFDDYTLPISESVTNYQLGYEGTPLVSTSSYNDYAQQTKAVSPDGSMTESSYYTASDGVLNTQVSFAPDADLNKTNQSDASLVYPSYQHNTIAKDSYGHTIIQSTTSGYETYDGSQWQQQAVYQNDYSYDQYGRVLKSILSYANAAPDNLKTGNVNSIEKDYVYLDNVNGKDSASICGLFPSGSCPSGVDASGLRAVITTETGSDVNNDQITPISQVSIVDRVSGVSLYQLTDPVSGSLSRYQHQSSTGYDNFGRVVAKTDPLGEVTTTSYSIGGGKNSITTHLPDGTTEVVDYNDFASPVRSLLSDGKKTLVTSQTSYDYDSGNGYGLVVKQVDSTGNSDRFFYNDQDQKLTDEKRILPKKGDSLSDAQYFYHYSVTDRGAIPDASTGSTPDTYQKISYNSYSCKDGDASDQCVDFYQVAQYDQKTNELLGSYTLKSGVDGLPDTVAAPTQLNSDPDDTTNADILIQAVRAAIKANDWISKKTMTYNGDHQLISSQRVTDKSTNSYIEVTRHYDALNRLVSVDNTASANGGMSKLSQGDEDLESQSLVYNLANKVIQRRLVPTGNVADASSYYQQLDRVYNALGELESMTFSGQSSGSAKASKTVFSDALYDAEGKLLSSKDAAGNIDHSSYDALGRVVKSWVSSADNSTLVTNTAPVCSIYNAQTGNLDYLYYDTSGTQVNSDGSNICTATESSIPAASQSNQLIHYQYDDLTHALLSKHYADGKMISTKYNDIQTNLPDGSIGYYRGEAKNSTDINGLKTVYSYSGVDQPDGGSLLKANLEDSSGNSLGLVSYSYTPESDQDCHAGELCSKSLGNGDKVLYNYSYDEATNPMKAVSSEITKDSKGNVISEIAFAYNTMGLLTKESVLQNVGSKSIRYTLDYSYDAALRLYKEVKTENGSSHGTVYSYDVNGNILTKTIDGSKTTYSYNALGQLVSSGVSYNSRGDEQSDEKGNDYTFNGYDQLVNFTSSSGEKWDYSYYPDGTRASKGISGGDTQKFYYRGDQLINSVLNNESTSYLMGATREERLLLNQDATLVSDASTAVHYYSAGHNDSTLGSLSADGESLSDVKSYTPYGEAVNEDTTEQENAQSSVQSLDLSTDPFGFNGEYLDQESGLVYLRARMYNPDSQRFMSWDSYPLLNHYAFVQGQVINAIDPSGHFSINTLAKGAWNGVKSGAEGVEKFSGSKAGQILMGDFDKKDAPSWERALLGAGSFMYTVMGGAVPQLMLGTASFAGEEVLDSHELGKGGYWMQLVPFQHWDNAYDITQNTLFAGWTAASVAPSAINIAQDIKSLSKTWDDGLTHYSHLKGSGFFEKINNFYRAKQLEKEFDALKKANPKDPKLTQQHIYTNVDNTEGNTFKANEYRIKRLNCYKGCSYVPVEEKSEDLEDSFTTISTEVDDSSSMNSEVVL